MATAVLRPTADFTASNGWTHQLGSSNPLWSRVDDDPDTPDDSDYMQGAAGANTGEVQLTLGPIPSDIGTVTAVVIRSRIRRSAAGDDTCSLFLSIKDGSNSSTIWNSTFRNATSITSFTTADHGTGSSAGAQDQARWNNAKLAVEATHTASMGNDGTRMNLSAVEVTITYTPSAPNTDLVIQNADHAHAADNQALTQVHSLAVQGSTHGHVADNLALTQVHALVVQDALHAHAAEQSNVAVNTDLVIAAALHALASPEVGLSQAHQLVVASGLHAVTSDQLGLTQVHSLIVANALHGHTAQNLALTQAHNLSIDPALHGHAADNVVLGLLVTLAIQSGAHAHSAEQILDLIGAIVDLIVEVGPPQSLLVIDEASLSSLLVVMGDRPRNEVGDPELDEWLVELDTTERWVIDEHGDRALWIVEERAPMTLVEEPTIDRS